MAQSTAILGFLAVVLVLFIIVLAVMFVGYKRLGRRRQAEENRNRAEPVVGTDRGPTSGPQQIHYRDNNSAMNEDVGGNLERVPRNNGDDETRRR